VVVGSLRDTPTYAYARTTTYDHVRLRTFPGQRHDQVRTAL